MCLPWHCLLLYVVLIFARIAKLGRC
jgi:hypothetical protein